MNRRQAHEAAIQLWGKHAKVKQRGDLFVAGFMKFDKFYARGTGESWEQAIKAASHKHKAVTKQCSTAGCNNTTEFQAGSTTRRYNHCVTCRLASQKREFKAKCRTPWCNRTFVMKIAGNQSIKDVQDKFCPDCRSNFSSKDGVVSFARVRALRLQVEMEKPITDIIIEAGRSAFDALLDRDGGMPGTIERFSANLGVTRRTLRDWLRFFFGLSWPDFKRKYICAAHSCSIVDVSQVTAAGKLSKYYPIDKFRKKGICSCPIWGDRLILVDKKPDQLQTEKLEEMFSQNKTPWVRQLKVISGSHLPLLKDQEDR